jgi:archaemetzincin
MNNMAPEYISIISFGYFEQNLLDNIAREVESLFHVRVIRREGHLDLSEFYDPVRHQYNGTTILKRVESDFARDPACALGLFNVDLFIPILTYIFGQAYLNGRAGIVSVYRLSNERYGLSKDDAITSDRLCKEVIHELGHMFGLIHCNSPVCVMRSSTYVEDIDQKEREFCSRCTGELKK